MFTLKCMSCDLCVYDCWFAFDIKMMICVLEQINHYRTNDVNISSWDLLLLTIEAWVHEICGTKFSFCTWRNLNELTTVRAIGEKLVYLIKNDVLNVKILLLELYMGL